VVTLAVVASPGSSYSQCC